MVARPRRDMEFHEFFKVYFPDQSSRQLRMPPAFVKQFSGATPRNVKLVDLSGKSWQVEVEEAENSIFFKNGWQKFASDHSLRLGNFLVFRYTGNSVYDVTIFGNNGCLNEETLDGQNYAKVKEEPEEDPSLTNPSPPSRGSQRKCTNMHLQRSEKAKARGACEVNRQKSPRIGPMTSGLGRASDVQEFTVPTNPHFIASFGPCTRNQMNIPRSLLNKIGSKMKEKMVLQVGGKRWQVGVHTCRDGKTIFSRGWFMFRRDNKLKLHDKCMFEFVSSNQVHVQILRAAAAADDDNSQQQLPMNNRTKKRLEDFF